MVVGSMKTKRADRDRLTSRVQRACFASRHTESDRYARPTVVIGCRRSGYFRPDEHRSVTLCADAPFDHMVLYAPAAHPELLCVEPVTNTVDFLNLDAPREDIGGGVLMPGQSISSRFNWSPRLGR